MGKRREAERNGANGVSIEESREAEEGTRGSREEILPN